MQRLNIRRDLFRIHRERIGWSLRVQCHHEHYSTKSVNQFIQSQEKKAMRTPLRLPRQIRPNSFDQIPAIPQPIACNEQPDLVRRSAEDEFC
jgi:hypothetical protein